MEELTGNKDAQDQYVGWRVPDTTTEEVLLASSVVHTIESALSAVDDDLVAVRVTALVGVAIVYGAARTADKTGEAIIERVE